ncbi:hypothetical protein [Bifidobacterium santillanense]|uniref:hypothetical protein n=1 Tax=Bifidobacterium santillanense TaxID=2809028 RepID=UPI001BDC4C33|nr:hypothetical protein [Bifidobacterium santillanense]
MLDAAMPRRAGLLASAVDVVRALGVRGLFFGVADCVFLGLVITLVVWAPLFAAVLSAPADGFGPTFVMSRAASAVSVAAWTRPGRLLVPLFVAAPMLYESVAVLTMLREREARMIELLRTCRWSFRRLTAVRMLVLGTLSTVVCVAFGACVALAGIHLDPVTTLGVSFASLFLFALAQLGADRYVRWPFSAAVVPVVWLAVGGALWRFRDLVTPWLLRLPPAVCLAAGLALALAYGLALDARCRGRETRDVPLPRPSAARPARAI